MGFAACTLLARNALMMDSGDALNNTSIGLHFPAGIILDVKYRFWGSFVRRALFKKTIYPSWYETGA